MYAMAVQAMMRSQNAAKLAAADTVQALEERVFSLEQQHRAAQREADELLAQRARLTAALDADDRCNTAGGSAQGGASGGARPLEQVAADLRAQQMHSVQTTERLRRVRDHTHLNAALCHSRQLGV